MISITATSRDDTDLDLQCIVFTAFNVFDSEMEPAFYTLIKAARKYVDMNMLAALPMHSEVWLNDAKVVLLEYSELRKVCPQIMDWICCILQLTFLPLFM